jgi:hypothetical protein
MIGKVILAVSLHVEAPVWTLERGNEFAALPNFDRMLNNRTLLAYKYVRDKNKFYHSELFFIFLFCN